MTLDSPNPEQWLSPFGLTQFRPGQRQVIEAIMDGQDTLCIMPTGGGKSLCYQLPSLARDGLTIVISPLIALMKDQVDSLSQLEIPATFINSSLDNREQQYRVQGMIDGRYQLVYVAPERLRSNAFLRACSQTSIQLFAIDEAHCISQWGHDFRPDYARLGRFRQRIGNPQTVALTATATELVQQDIVKILDLKQPAVFVTGFARENLSLQVRSPNGNMEKDQQLVEFVKSCTGGGIIYCSTRKNCEHLAEHLADEGVDRVAIYHGGLPPQTRRAVQDDFMAGGIRIIIATNAFGMGIDKPDLRFVLHYNLPGSVEAYYQEAGRAGRDGLPSDCLLLYSYQDKFIQEFFIENSYPSQEIVKQVYEHLRSIHHDPIELSLQEIKDELGLSIGTSGIGTCEHLLEKAGAIERLDSSQNSAAIRIDSDLPTLVDLLKPEAKAKRRVMRGLENIVDSFRGERVLFNPQRLAKSLDMKWDAVSRSIRELGKLSMVDYIPPFRGRAVHVVDRKKTFPQLEIDFDELQRRKQSEYDKLQRVIKLATTRRCRQLEILEYFGDVDRKECGICDNCRETLSTPTKPTDRASFDACLYAAQVALSGTARTHGRIGKTLIAQMLTGSSSKKIKQLQLDRLSPFGLLKMLRQTDVADLMDFLIQQNYIEQIETTKFRPVVQISETGQLLMAGNQPADLTTRMPSQLVSLLSDKLKDKKPHLKTAQPKTKPIANSAQESMQESDSDLATVTSTSESPVVRPVDPKPKPTPNLAPPSHYWTWKLLSEGYPVDQVKQIRQLDLDTIFDHASRAIEAGLSVELPWLLPTEKLTGLQQLVDNNPDSTTAELITKLPADLHSRDLLYYLKKLASA